MYLHAVLLNQSPIDQSHRKMGTLETKSMALFRHLAYSLYKIIARTLFFSRRPRFRVLPPSAVTLYGTLSNHIRRGRRVNEKQKKL